MDAEMLHSSHFNFPKLLEGRRHFWLKGNVITNQNVILIGEEWVTTPICNKSHILMICEHFLSKGLKVVCTISMHTVTHNDEIVLSNNHQENIFLFVF